MAKFNQVSTLIATALLGSAALAHADNGVTLDAEGQRTISVDIADISLADPADMAKLDMRIAQAVSKVCERPFNDNTLTARSAERSCIADTSERTRIAVIAKLESKAAAERVAVR